LPGVLKYFMELLLADLLHKTDSFRIVDLNAVNPLLIKVKGRINLWGALVMYVQRFTGNAGEFLFVTIRANVEVINNIFANTSLKINEGIYLVEVNNGENRIIQKLVVQ
jgi:hypothetical protein